MLIGIEFKRTKVRMDDGRSVWFWRVAPYSEDIDKTKLVAFTVITVGMSLVFMIAG